MNKSENITKINHIPTEDLFLWSLREQEGRALLLQPSRLDFMVKR